MGVTMLEASAGTGKTYSIASLVLRLVVEERLGIDEILVVTFTEAATSELRDRVRRRLRDALTLAERTLATGALPAGAWPARRATRWGARW
jgi:exodeoxyribonuclease V beta subunit